MNLLLSLILFFFMASNAGAATYGPANEPCETGGTLVALGDINTVLEAATQDETYRLAAGTHTPSGQQVIISATGVTVVPDNCAAVTVAGEIQVRGSGSAIRGLTLDYTVTTAGRKGIVIRPATLNGTQWAEDIVIANNTIITRGSVDSTQAIRLHGDTRNITITGNDINHKGSGLVGNAVFYRDDVGGAVRPPTDIKFNNNKVQRDFPGVEGDCFGVGADTGNLGPGDLSGTANEINNNWFLNCADENAIDIKGMAGTNPVLNIKGNLCDGSNIPSGCFLIHTATAANTTINVENNAFINCNGQRCITLGGKNNASENNDFRIRIVNNLMSGSATELFRNDVNHTVMYNNTINGGDVQMGGAFNPTIAEFRNNIVANGSLDNRMVSGLTCSHNLFFNLTGDNFDGRCTNTQTGDPLFTSVGTGDFTISSKSSSAYNNGTAVSGVGCNNPSCDIGAYEIMEISPPIIGNIAANKIAVTVECNRYGCLTASNPLTGATAKINAVADTLTAASQVSNVLTYTTTTTSLSTDVWLWSYNSATGNITDNAPFTFKQKLLSITDQTVTNQVTGAAGALTFVAAGAAGTSTTNTSPAPGLPAGLAANDLMIAALTGRDTNFTVSDPAGWTILLDPVQDTGRMLGLWYCFYPTCNAAPSWTLTSNTGEVVAQIAAYRGVNTTAPISEITAKSLNVSGANIGPITGLSLAADNAVVVIGMKRRAWTSVATLSGDGLTWVEVGEPDLDSGFGGTGLVWNHAINGSSPVTVTSKTFSVTGGVSDTGAGVMVELNVLVTPPGGAADYVLNEAGGKITLEDGSGFILQENSIGSGSGLRPDGAGILLLGAGK